MKNEIYDNLCNMKFESIMDWPQICNIINFLPKEHTEILYTLILHHYFVESSTKNTIESIASTLLPTKTKSKNISLPYGGKTFENGKGAIYLVEKIPSHLQYVISAYVHVITGHIK